MYVPLSFATWRCSRITVGSSCSSASASSVSASVERDVLVRFNGFSLSSSNRMVSSCAGSSR